MRYDLLNPALIRKWIYGNARIGVQVHHAESNSGPDEDEAILQIQVAY